MTSPIKGLTFPNRQWSLYTAAEEAAIIDLHPTGILVLGYPQSSILRDKIAQDVRLWRELGEPEFILRPYAPDLVDWKPIEWANVCLELIEDYVEAGIPRARIELLLANEMNREGWGEDWLGIIHWLNATGGFVHLASPATVQHIPALSPEGDYLHGYDAIALFYDWVSFGKVDAHVYTVEQAALLPRIQAAFGDRPLVVTEYNRMFPSTLLRIYSSYPWFIGAYNFILFWDQPEPGAPDVSLISDSNSNYYQDFADYKEMPTMTKEDLWKQLTAPWESYPALGKAIVALDGQVIGTEVTFGEYVFQLGIVPIPADRSSIDVVAWCKIGDWGHVEVSYIASTLPDVEAASH